MLDHLSGKHQVPVEHPHLHLPALRSHKVVGITSISHMVKFVQFLKPAHWSNSFQVTNHLTDIPVVSGASWDCWNVDVTVNEGVGAIPVKELDMQGHPYLGDGEGGAGVLLAVAGSLMGE